MSYPRLIQPLIIEDDYDAHFLYETIFEILVLRGVTAPPKFAYCFDDAAVQLASDMIFLLVILDLRLPECPGVPPSEGVEFGLNVLELCVNHDQYPILALLVVSGAIEKARQLELEDRVRNGFSYGQVLVKGLEIEKAIEGAVEHVDKHCSLGIHVQDGGESEFPTISPREEDLLRRCILNQEGCTGIDVRWWSAEYARPTGEYAEYMGWTKTLMGRFLLSNGDRAQRPNFFKFSPARGASVVSKTAKLMEHKLSHVKLRCNLVSDTRSLLVTEKVGNSHESPIPLSTFLGFKSEEVWNALPVIAQEITEQVLSLGTLNPRVAPVKRLLWQSHNRERLQSQWDVYARDEWSARHSLTTNPLALYDRFMADPVPIRFEETSFTHGDLNITNIALDQSPSAVHGYIFDAEGSTPGVNIRDLAMLEVTALLHQQTNGGTSLVEQCARLYEIDASPPPADYTAVPMSDVARNTWRFIALVREFAFEHSPSHLYALMVFDAALIQLGGLAFTVSRNKIVNPPDAALLVGLASRWLLDLKERS